MNPITLRERILYHQIHPLKLTTDWISGFVAAWLFWQHRLAAGLVVGFIPPLVASALLLRFANLGSLKDTALGRYIEWNMTRPMEAVRLAGAMALWLGAWIHQWWLIMFSIVIILAGWLRGTLPPAKGRA
jgi:hypothetical protein